MIETHALAATSVFAELSIALLLLPVHGDRRVPARAKISLLLFLSFLSFGPRQEVLSSEECRSLGTPEIILISISLGVILGVSSRVPIVVASVVGAIISQAGSFSQILNPVLTEDVSTIFGSILSFSLLYLLAFYQLHYIVLDYLLTDRFQCIPVSGIGEDTILYLGYLIEQAIFAIVSLSYPFFLISVLYFVSIGLVGRAMPQFMAMLVGTPVLQLITVIFLVAFVGELLSGVISTIDSTVFRR